MTPLQLQIALRYHTRRGEGYIKTDPTYTTSPAVYEATMELAYLGLLIPSGEDFEPTPGLKVYIEKLLSVPLPKLIWGYDQETGQ